MVLLKWFALLGLCRSVLVLGDDAAAAAPPPPPLLLPPYATEQGGGGGDPPPLPPNVLSEDAAYYSELQLRALNTNLSDDHRWTISAGTVRSLLTGGVFCLHLLACLPALLPSQL